MAHLTCAWCKKELRIDAEVLALAGKITRKAHRDSFMAGKRPGQATELHLFTANRDIPAVIPPAGSQFERDGKHIVISACSVSCVESLKTAILEEQGLIDAVFS